MTTESQTPLVRGDTTREALISAAIEVFGREGFNAASTRAISEAAGVNQALIGYHFGGKPGLYLAALKLIADRVGARLGPLVATVETELEAEDTQAEAAAARATTLLHKLTDALVAMLTSDESTAWARLILREQQDPTEGFDVLYEGIMGRVLGVIRQLVARVRHADASSDQCKLTALTIVGQALVFRAARAAVMRQMGWSRLTVSEVEVIKAELRRNVAAILEAETRA